MARTTRRWAAALILLSPAAAVAQVPATGPATRSARSPDQILAEMNAAKGQLQAAIGDAHVLADPAKRAAIADRALPPLRTLLADNRELAAATGHPPPSAAAFELQLRATMSALGDGESTDTLAKLAADPSPDRAQAGQAGQLLAHWFQVPGEAAGQSKVVDDVAAADAAHPDSDLFASYTFLMSTSAATPAVRDRLRGLLGPMTSRTAVALRQRLAAAAPQP